MNSDDEDLHDKICIVTGANTGIGYETAVELAKRGAQVVLACRDLKRAQEAANQIKSMSKSEKIYIEELDLASLESVRNFVKSFQEKYNRLDILVNNAGVFFNDYSKTKDGFEMHFGVNHLGHFLLTNLLLDLLKSSQPSRIINVSSAIYSRGKIEWDDINLEKDYSGIKGYSQSKLANVLFTIELAKRLENTNVTAISLHPGFIKTEITRNNKGLFKLAMRIASIFAKSQSDGAKTSIYCCANKDIKKHTGKYFSDCKVEELSTKVTSLEDAERLWKLSSDLVKL